MNGGPPGPGRAGFMKFSGRFPLLLAALTFVSAA